MKKNLKKEIKIDLKILVNIFSNNYKKIIITSFMFLIIGIFYSINIENQYRSFITFIPSYNKSNNSELNSIANIAGINLNNQKGNYLSPNLYPIIFNNINFKRKVLKIKLDETKTLNEYLIEKEKSLINNLINNLKNIPAFIISLPSKLFSTFSKESNEINKNTLIDKNYIVTIEENNKLNTLEEILKIDVNKRDQHITISTNFNNPIFSSIITLKSYLSHFISILPFLAYINLLILIISLYKFIFLVLLMIPLLNLKTLHTIFIQ